MSPWQQSVLGLAGLAAVMTALWLLQRRTRDAGTVDVAWAGGLGAMALFTAERIRSSSSSMSSGETTLCSMEIFLISCLPLMVTRTMPPPTSAVVSSARSFSCVSCMRDCSSCTRAIIS